MTDPKENKYGELDGLDDLNAASQSDCTGLLYRPPVSPEEEEAYEDVYHYLPPSPSVVEDAPPVILSREDTQHTC